MGMQRWMAVGWSAFLSAAVIEVLVFAAFDPQDMVWLGQSLQWSRMAIYTLTFFVLWAVLLVAAWAAVLLVAPPAQINAQHTAR